MVAAQAGLDPHRAENSALAPIVATASPPFNLLSHL